MKGTTGTSKTVTEAATERATTNELLTTKTSNISTAAIPTASPQKQNSKVVVYVLTPLFVLLSLLLFGYICYACVYRKKKRSDKKRKSVNTIDVKPV